jgi:hypothetical protein
MPSSQSENQFSPISINSGGAVSNYADFYIKNPTLHPI